MSIERVGWNGPITWVCDECGKKLDTEVEDFYDALDELRANGWVSRNDGDDWEHYCEDCK